MSQTERVLKHLKRHRRIDSMTAQRELGIARLAARILDLRDSGHDIRTVMKRVRGRFGESRIAEYRYG